MNCLIDDSGVIVVNPDVTGRKVFKSGLERSSDMLREKVIVYGMKFRFVPLNG